MRLEVFLPTVNFVSRCRETNMAMANGTMRRDREFCVWFWRNDRFGWVEYQEHLVIKFEKDLTRGRACIDLKPQNIAIKALGGVDVIFLNAGIMPTAPLSAMKTDEWHQTVDINIKGVLNGVAAVLPTFISQKSGQVIANSSVAGLKAYPGGAVYGGSKWFVRDFMEVLRMESAQEGTNIRTATIYPAAINTELLGTITHEFAAQAMAALYKQHGISADRVANVVAFAIDQPADTNVSEFTIGPTTQPW